MIGDTEMQIASAQIFRHVSKSNSNGSYEYTEGIDIDPADYDLDSIRFRVRGGLIVGVTDDSGNPLQGSG